MKVLSKISTIALMSAAGTMAFVSVANAEFSMRIASEEPFGDPPVVAAQYGIEYVEAHLPDATDGYVTVNIYPGAALGTESDLVRSVGTGIVDATVMSPGNLAAVIPEVQLFSASYLFTDYDHAQAVLSDPEFLERMREIVASHDAGFQLAGLSLTGTRNLYNRLGPVSEQGDIEGMSMRVMASQTEFDVWSALGTLPTNIPAPEIYTALQTGVVDAAESSLPAIVGNRYFEVAPHIVLTHHQFNLHFYLIGDHVLERVPEEYHDAMFEVFRDATVEQIQGAIELSEQSLEFLRDQEGVTVSEVDTAEFAATLAHIQDEVATDLGVEDLLEMIRAKGQ